MTTIHPELLQYLLNYKPTEEIITIELLEQKIKEMEDVNTLLRSNHDQRN